MNQETQSPGRVSLQTGADNASRLPGFAYPTTAPSNAGQEGIRGNFEKTPLNQAFFSSENFQIIQNKIRKSVYDASGEIIDPVSTDDLFMVMRAIYLQTSKNLPTGIAQQIDELNERIATWCIPKILAEVSMYKTYTKDISTLPVPMSHPVNQSSAGTKSLPFKEFF
jgi:hypothetical protein